MLTPELFWSNRIASQTREEGKLNPLDLSQSPTLLSWFASPAIPHALSSVGRREERWYIPENLAFIWRSFRYLPQNFVRSDSIPLIITANWNLRCFSFISHSKLSLFAHKRLKIKTCTNYSFETSSPSGLLEHYRSRKSKAGFGP